MLPPGVPGEEWLKPLPADRRGAGAADEPAPAAEDPEGEAGDERH